MIAARSSGPIRVVLIDDHEVVRVGLREMLGASAGLEVVAEASTAEDGITRVGALRPDVAILDVELPDRSGVEVCREVKQRWPAVRCVMLTSHTEDAVLFDSIQAGADAYVLKQLRGNDLVDAVRCVAAGGSLLDPAVTGRVLERLRGGSATDERLAEMSEREQEIVRRIAEGWTNRQIAERLSLAEKTIKNNVSAILAKTGMKRRTEIAAWVARQERPRMPESSTQPTSHTPD